MNFFSKARSFADAAVHEICSILGGINSSEIMRDWQYTCICISVCCESRLRWTDIRSLPCCNSSCKASLRCLPIACREFRQSAYCPISFNSLVTRHTRFWETPEIFFFSIFPIFRNFSKKSKSHVRGELNEMGQYRLFRLPGNPILRDIGRYTNTGQYGTLWCKPNKAKYWYRIPIPKLL